MSLTLMCGSSFSGKSTLAEQVATRLNAELVSLDDINLERGLLGGQGIPVEEWAATTEIAHERARRALRNHRDVVVDDTGSPRFIRDEWRSIAKECGTSFTLVWVQIDGDLQRRRIDANRSTHGRHDITEEVLLAHRAAFEPPITEDAIVIDARDTRQDAHISRVVAAVRSQS